MSRKNDGDVYGLPERKSYEESFTLHGQGQIMGWNACLDAVKPIYTKLQDELNRFIDAGNAIYNLCDHYKSEVDRLIEDLRLVALARDAFDSQLTHWQSIAETEAQIRLSEKSEASKTEEAYNAVISYMLGKGYTEEPLEFLRCWNEGDFDALREEWPDAPKEIYYADPLYKGE